MPDWSAEGAAQFYETSVFALQWKGLTPDLSHTLPGIGPTCARKNSEECERAASRVTDPQVCASTLKWPLDGARWLIELEAITPLI